MPFRLVGPSGVGKSAAVYELARQSNSPLYMLNCHEEMTVEDMAVTACITADQGLEYVGSRLLAAVVRGGICFADEIGKLPVRSMSLLTSLLDDKHYIDSALAKITPPAHPNFRLCVALNTEDEIGLPKCISERLGARFEVGPPTPARLIEIVRHHLALPDGENVLLEAFREEVAGRTVPSPRVALTIVRFARQQWVSGDRKNRDEARRLIREAFEVVN